MLSPSESLRDHDDRAFELSLSPQPSVPRYRSQERKTLHRGLLGARGARGDRPLPFDAVEGLDLDGDGVAAVDADARRNRKERLLPARANVRRLVGQSELAGQMRAKPHRGSGDDSVAQGMKVRGAAHRSVVFGAKVDARDH